MSAPDLEAIRVGLVELYVQSLGAADDRTDFFRAGGTSFQAARLVSAVRARFCIPLSLQALFDDPQPIRLAERIADAVRLGSARAGDTSRLPALPGFTPRPDTVDLRRWHPVGRMQRQRLTVDRRLTEFGRTPPAHNISVMLRLSGDLDVAALRGAVGAVLRRHPMLRTVFRWDGTRWTQRALSAAHTARLDPLEIADLAEDQLDTALAELANRRFDLSTGPLLRTRLFRLGPGEHALVVVVEHLAADGTSMDLILDGLAEGYGQALHGPVDLAPETVAYADFASAEHEWIEDRGGLPELDFWRDRLSSTTRLPYADIPLGSPVPPASMDRLHDVRVSLAPGAHRRMLELANRDGIPWLTWITAAAHLAIGGLCGGDQIASVSPLANRQAAGLDRTVGWHANLVPTATSAAERDDRARMLHTVRNHQLAAIENAAMPFWHVMDTLYQGWAERPPSWLYVDVGVDRADSTSPATPGWPGLRVARRYTPIVGAGLGMDVSGSVSESGTELVAMGRQDRFSPDEIAEVARAAEEALRGVVDAVR